MHAATLSTVEVGLGSVLHGFRVPLAGNFLSLNQGFLLSRALLATDRARRNATLPASVSAVAAVLKSLSPAGKRLEPMLAISVQGVLYSAGPCVFGINAAGVLTGMVLLSFWSFAQPLVIYLLLFGEELVLSVNHMLAKAHEAVGIEPSSVAWAFAGLVAAKALLALLVGLAALHAPESWVQRYQGKLLALGTIRIAARREEPRGRPPRSPMIQALLDLMNPLFLASLALTALFFVFARHPGGGTAWVLLRPVALGYFLFLAVRLLPVRKLFSRGALKIAYERLSR